MPLSITSPHPALSPSGGEGCATPSPSVRERAGVRVRPNADALAPSPGSELIRGAASHRDGCARDVARPALMLEPVGLAEAVRDALEREDVGHDALEGEAAEIAAQEGQRLLERPRRIIRGGHEARVAAYQHGRVVGEHVAGRDAPHLEVAAP